LQTQKQNQRSTLKYFPSLPSMHRLRKEIQQKRHEFDTNASQANQSQLSFSNQHASQQLQNEQIIENLVQQKVFLNEMVKDLFSNVEQLFEQAEKDQESNLATINELTKSFQHKEDELRLSLEKGRLDEHKSELKFKEEMSLLEKRSKKLHKQNTEYKKDIQLLEKTITRHENEIANQKKELEGLHQKLARIKTYPEVYPKVPRETPNQPLLSRLNDSLKCICSYISSFNHEITLNEQYNPVIMQPAREFIRKLRITLSHATKDPQLQLWSYVLKPLLELQMDHNMDLQEIKSVVRKVEAGTISNAFRDGDKSDTFLLHCLNHQKLYTWISFIYMQPSVLDKYEEVAVMRNPVTRDRLLRLLVEISHLRFNIFNVTDRLNAEKEWRG